MELNKEELKRSLGNCEEHHSFVLRNGERVSSIQELASRIAQLEDHEFRHHVSEDGKVNHFASWVNDVFDNEHLARDMQYENNLSDKAEMSRTLNDHLDWLKE